MVQVAVTGIGLVTPLGFRVAGVVDRLLRGETAVRPAPFNSLGCPVFAPVDDFDAGRHFPENKTLRLMNRDAQMAAVAARLAMADAGIASGSLYPPEEIALYGATGLSGLPAEEIARLVRESAGEDGSLDLARFGQVALRRVRPVLSFKILANMPICFVSILEDLRGPNAVYTPWEGQGAQAIAAGVRAVRHGEAPCAVVGGCDVKTHVLSFLSLRQWGVFDSWIRHGCGTAPGEGAAFLVLEDCDRAVDRVAKVYACIGGEEFRSVRAGKPMEACMSGIIGALSRDRPSLVVAAGDGDRTFADAEEAALERAGLAGTEQLHPKKGLGNLFAASAAVQVAMAAEMVARGRPSALANCFGPGSEQASFRLEAA